MKIKEIGLLILLLIPAVLALFRPGFFGASDEMHIAWLQQMDQAVREGQIPPRYVSDLSFGFGYPLFNFIFPLPYYLGELFHVVGLSLVDSIKAVFIFSLIGSGITMYVLMRKLSGKWLGMAAAVLYVYSPYRSTEVYVRGALGEAMSFVFLPLIIYFIIKFSENLKKKYVFAGSMSLMGLILTHNIIAYMFVPLVFVFGAIILRKQIMALMMMFLGGLLGSIYFWLPALLDSKLMKYETVFNFFDHFPTIKQLLTPYWGYGASVPGNYDGISFFIGEINLIVLAIIVVFLIFRFSKLSIRIKQILIWSLCLIIVSGIMMNFRSTWLWQHLPLIAYFQFPWRFLLMVVFGTALVVAGFQYFKYLKIWAILIIVVAIGLNISRFKPHDFLNRTDNYYLNRYIPIPTPSQEYLSLKEEYLRLPKASEIRPTQNYDRVYPKNNAIKDVRLINNLDARIIVETDSEIVLNYNKYYFPGWRGTIDGKKLVLVAGSPYGQIQFLVPSGKHEIVIKYRETGFNIFLDLISLLTIGVCIYFLVW